MSTVMNTVDYLGTVGDGTTAILPSGASMPVVGRGVYNRTLLKRAYPELMHQSFGQIKPLGQRKGQSMVFRRYEKNAQATTPLSDGVTPPGTALTKTDYVATLKQYGNYMIITDWVDMTHVDPVITEASALMGENMGESMDSVYREPLVAGTSVYYVTGDAGGTVGFAGSARTDVNGTIGKAVLDAAIRDLDGENAKHFTPQINGSTKVNTYPVAAAYWALIHTDQVHDLYATNSDLAIGDEFVPVERYAGGTGVMMNEVGKYRNIRFVTSTNTKVWPGSATAGGTTGAGTTYKSADSTHVDVYAVLIFARDAYGVVPLQRGSARVIIERAGGPSDPLRQRNSVGWKAAGVSVILNDAWMVRLECATLA